MQDPKLQLEALCVPRATRNPHLILPSKARQRQRPRTYSGLLYLVVPWPLICQNYHQPPCLRFNILCNIAGVKHSFNIPLFCRLSSLPYNKSCPECVDPLPVVIQIATWSGRTACGLLWPEAQLACPHPHPNFAPSCILVPQTSQAPKEATLQIKSIDTVCCSFLWSWVLILGQQGS